MRGEVRLTSYTAEPPALARYGPLRRQDGSIALTIQNARAAKGGLIVRAKEVATKETADEDEFYLADLIGLAARGADGEPLGAVKAVHNFGAGDVVELDPGAGRATLVYPFTREVFPEVRIADGYVTVVPPVDDDSGAEDADRG